MDDPRGDKSRLDGGCQVPLEVTNVPDTRNIKAPQLETDDRRSISVFVNASSVGVNSGGATRKNSVDSRLRLVAATTAPLLAGESVQRILSRKDPMTTDPTTLQVSGILQRAVDPRSLNPVRAVGNTLEKRVETQRDDRGQEEKRGAGAPDFRIGAEEAWNRRLEEPVSLRDRQCMELVHYALTIRYTSDGHYFLQLQHKAQEVIHAKKTLNDQIVPTAWEFLEDTLALFYVI